MQTSLSLLKSCTGLSELQQIHARMIKSGLDAVPFNVSNLLSAAVLAGFASYARSIFDLIPTPNLFQHNTILRSHSLNQTNPDVRETIALFNSLRARDIPLDQFSFIATIKACAQAATLHAGQQVHASILQSGFELVVDLRNSLIHFYCTCGALSVAHRLFDEIPTLRDAASWSSLMGGYLRASQPGGVMFLFRQMTASGSKINAAALVTAISAVVDAGYSDSSMHGYCIKYGLCSDLNVATAVVTMYSKSHQMDSSRMVFDEVRFRDVVLYNCVVDGYARNGNLEESLVLLRRMRDERVRPNSATFVGLLCSCAASGALSVGRLVHEHIENSLKLDVNLGTALVDMYSKCGCLEEAIGVFDRMEQRDVKAWTAMIMGLAVNSREETALELFNEMEEKGVRPNEVTFLAVLSACSHGGLVDSGRQCLERMVRDYGLKPGIEHYGCMIDMLGRAGLLEEAHELVKNLPLKGDAVAWRALLAACRVHGDVKLGESARRTLVEMGDEHPTDSILMANAHAIAGKLAEFERTDSAKGNTMNRKEAGCSSIELGG